MQDANCSCNAMLLLFPAQQGFNMTSPKMSRYQAKMLWNSLTPQQKAQFNHMMAKMQKGDLMIGSVNVDDNETLQNIVLKPKEKPSTPDKPFYELFKGD